MKLNPEGVEKAAVAVCLTHKWASPDDVAKAALTAYFAHLKEAGLMREAGGSENSTGWLASSCPESVLFNDGDFDCLIIRTDKE